jgi:hypothetical protein
MLDFIKKIFGFPTQAEIEAAKAQRNVTYTFEPLVVNNKSGEPVVQTEPVVQPEPVVVAEEPVKKTRKPRTPKAETPAKVKVVAEKPSKKVTAKGAAKVPKKS